jgi:hypothetical protein
LKRVYLVAGIAGIAIVAATIIIVSLYSQNFQSQQRGFLAGKSFTSGNFTVTVVEDSESRFLAKLENRGPTLENTGAFAVKNRLNENCEPQGIVVANFQISQQGNDSSNNSKLVIVPDSIKQGSTVNIDSRQAAGSNMPKIPVGNDVKTTIYIMRLEPNSVKATDLVQRIDLQNEANNTSNQTELQSSESCLQKSGKGYPLLLHLKNPSPGSQVFFTITDSVENKQYETALKMTSQGSSNNNNNVPNELFWPPSREGWLANNFTQTNGPAPTWMENPQELTLSVKVVKDSGSNIQEFKKVVKLDGLHESSLDFVNVAEGKAVPIYPKYWEISVDLASK